MFPHYGLHSTKKCDARSVDIAELFDFKNCNCSEEDIQKYKERCKVKIIICSVCPCIIFALIILVNYFNGTL